MRQVLAKLFNRPDELENAVDLARLTRLVRRYAVEQQHVPKDLLDLVTLKYLGSIPVPPHGQRLVIDRRKVEVKLE